LGQILFTPQTVFVSYGYGRRNLTPLTHFNLIECEPGIELLHFNKSFDTVQFSSSFAKFFFGQICILQYIQQTYAAWTGLIPGKIYNISVVAEDATGVISLPAFIVVSTGKRVTDSYAVNCLYSRIYESHGDLQLYSKSKLELNSKKIELK